MFALMSLDSNGKNEPFINVCDGLQAHVTLVNRTLYQDNTWNTIYLPFDMTIGEFAASPLGDADIRVFGDATVNGTNVMMNFTPDAVNAYGGYYGGISYIVKWASGSNIVNPEFANVTITNGSYSTGGATTDGSASVYSVGTYDKMRFGVDMPTVLFVGENNKLNYPLAGATIGANRGYFILDGISAAPESGIKFFTNLDDEDPTGIANINSVEGNDDWYDLSGRKLAGKPSVKGIYVNGGRKVTVK